MKEDLKNLATETLDLWQEHLATLAADPKMKADLAQMLEPSQRLFAEWIKKVQTAPHGTAPFAPAEAGPGTGAANGAEDRAAPVRPASDDGALRLAQLALHVAELEKRVAKLESRKSSAAKTAGTSREPG